MRAIGRALKDLPHGSGSLSSLLLAAAEPAAAPSQGHIETPDGARLFYKVVGEGTDTLVVVHGGPGNSLSSIEPDLAPLAAGRRIIYYDQRGAAAPTWSPTTTSWRSLTTSPISTRSALISASQRMKLLGNSWGGLLVAAYAAAHPDRIERMIMHDSAPPPGRMIAQSGAELTARARRALRRRKAPPLQPAVRSPLTGSRNDRSDRATCREWAPAASPDDGRAGRAI